MTRIKWSKGPDEWYCSYGTCCKCNTEFMCSKAHYCPGCGEEIESEEKYKDCFQPKSNEKPLDEEVAKAFQLGLAFGLMDYLNAKNDDMREELRKLEKPYCKDDPKESEE